MEQRHPLPFLKIDIRHFAYCSCHILTGLALYSKIWFYWELNIKYFLLSVSSSILFRSGLHHCLCISFVYHLISSFNITTSCTSIMFKIRFVSDIFVEKCFSRTSWRFFCVNLHVQINYCRSFVLKIIRFFIACIIIIIILLRTNGERGSVLCSTPRTTPEANNFRTKILSRSLEVME